MVSDPPEIVSIMFMFYENAPAGVNHKLFEIASVSFAVFFLYLAVQFAFYDCDSCTGFYFGI